MFGSVGAFVNGNMFAGLFGEHIGVKLDQESLAELSALRGSGPSGRNSGQWAATCPYPTICLRRRRQCGWGAPTTMSCSCPQGEEASMIA